MIPLILALIGAAQAEPVVAIAVVDQEARDHGYALEIDGWVADRALPVEIAEGEHVAIVGPDGHVEPLDLMPGEAWEISGPDGEAWASRIGDEIRTDLLAVRGTDASIAALAEALDAQVVADGTTVWLSRDGILFDAPWADDEGELDLAEVGLVRVEARRDPARTGAAGAARVPAPVTAATAPELPAREAVVAPVAAPVTPEAPAAEPVGEATDAPSPATHADDDEAFAGWAARERYAGLFLCRDDVLWLHPSGVFSLRGIQGSWTVGAPGVVRLMTDDGAVLFRAAVSPDGGGCRAVWSPEDVGEAPADGFVLDARRSRPGRAAVPGVPGANP